MVENTERRKSARIAHTSPLKVKDRNSGKGYKGSMFNYSDDGLYFESDSVLQSGDLIYIGIQDSPYAYANSVFEYKKSEIMWRKKLKDSYYEYGYGVKFCAELNKKNQERTNYINKTTEEGDQNVSIRNTIEISDQGRSYKGLIKDISPLGVFFAAEDKFEEGQILSFSIPAKNNKEIKIDGQIVWVAYCPLSLPRTKILQRIHFIHWLYCN